MAQRCVVAGPGETKADKRRGATVTANGPAVVDERRAFALDLESPVQLEPQIDAVSPQYAEATQPAVRRSAVPRRTVPMPNLASLQGRARIAFVRALVDEAEFGTPFLLVPIALLIGVATYFTLPAEPARHNVPLALGLGLMVLWLARRRSRLLARGVLAICLVLAGMSIAQWQTMARATQMLGAEVTTQLTGRIARMEMRPNGSVRYTLDVIETQRPQLRHAPDRVRVTARSPAPDARVGDGLSGRARLFPLSGPARPGGYDFAFHGYFAGHGANGFFYGPPEQVSVPPHDGLLGELAGRLQNVRLWLGDRIRSAAPGQAGTVAAALVNGDKSAIPEPVNEALRVSGLAHILTISGLHMALVAGTVMIALRAAFALSAPFASGHAVKKYAALAAFGAIFVYLFLAGAGVATQRSFTMLAVMLAALMLDRRAISKRNLAIAAIIIIVLSPSAVVGPSFHMSFAATLALIALYDIWTRARTERLRRTGAVHRPEGLAAAGQGAWRFIIALAATSIVAGAASGLYAAYHFHRVAILGLVTNLAAMPIVSLVTMPLAIVATLAIPFGVDGPLYSLMAISAGWILAIAQWVADRSPHGMVGAMSDPAMLAATAALAWFCVCRTWLRWGALLPALVAIPLMGQKVLPVAVISEDGRQIALVGSDGALAVNRLRPNGFNLRQWQMAYAARSVLKPEPLETHGAESIIAWDGRDQSENAEETTPLRCGDGLCVGEVIRDGRVFRLLVINEPPAEPALRDHIALTAANTPAATRTAADVICGRFNLIVLTYAPATSPCAGGARVLTAQDLALKGSAEIFVNGRDTAQFGGNNEVEDGADATEPSVPAIAVHHAVSMPLRPWHDHRRWSRSARNLAPRE